MKFSLYLKGRIINSTLILFHFRQLKLLIISIPVLQKKVQPDLVVDTKPSGRSRLSKGQEDKFRRQWEQEQYWQWKK